MYPREITTTSIWIRHNLPICAPPPPNGDEKLRKQIRARNTKATNEMIQQFVREERARLNLKWCLDEYFGGNVSDPVLGQLVTANVVGIVHIAYLVEITAPNIIVTPVEMFGSLVTVGFDDIYSAEDGPFYDNFLLKHRVLHPQHVLNCFRDQKEFVQVNNIASFDMFILDCVYDDSEIDWPAGEEAWLIHDELPQRIQFVQCKQEISSDDNYVVSSPHVELLSFMNTDQLPDNDPVKREFSAEQIIKLQQTSRHSPVALQSPTVSSLPVYDSNGFMAVNIDGPDEEITLDWLPSYMDKVDLRTIEKNKLKYNVLLPSLHRRTTFSLGGSILLCVLLGLFLQSFTIFSAHPFNSSLTDIVPEIFSLVSMAIGIIVSHWTLNSKKNSGYFCHNILSRDTNDRDWFRTLAVP